MTVTEHLDAKFGTGATAAFETRRQELSAKAYTGFRDNLDAIVQSDGFKRWKEGKRTALLGVNGDGI